MLGYSYFMVFILTFILAFTQIQQVFFPSAHGIKNDLIETVVELQFTEMSFDVDYMSYSFSYKTFPNSTNSLYNYLSLNSVSESTIPSSPNITNVILKEFSVPIGSRPHDVSPAPDGSIWYTAQSLGELGKLDPATGNTSHIPLGEGSAPHGVIVGPDGAPWITDGGLNAIVRVDPLDFTVKVFELPEESGYANLNTATFDNEGILWFTGQSGIYGKLDPISGKMEVFDAPGGPGPYGITATPNGSIYYASLAGSHIASINTQNGSADIINPPTPDQGARRVWSDSQGRIWVSEWNVGRVGLYDPQTSQWKEWVLPGNNPMPYAVYVDEKDMVWISDFGANAMVRFDPNSERFEIFSIPSSEANVRQILGRPGEIWGAESGTDKILMIQTGG